MALGNSFFPVEQIKNNCQGNQADKAIFAETGN